MTSASWVKNWEPISDAVRHKGRKYGDLKQPLVVAVNAGTFHVDVRDELQALFGQETVTIDWERPDEEPTHDRAGNGAYRGPKGPRGTRVSGTWIFNNISLYTVAERRHMLYLNPWAKYDLMECLRELPRTVVVDGWAKASPGISLRALFGLHEGWPNPERRTSV
jgi:hypothetical protein